MRTIDSNLYPVDHAGFLAIYLCGGVQIRRDKAREALGTELADRYLGEFFELFPRAADMSIPSAAKDELDPKAEELEGLVRQVVGDRLRKL